LLIKTDGTRILTRPDGTIITTISGPDPRWGMQAPVTTSSIVTTPSGRSQQTTASLTANLQNVSDPLSLVSLLRSTTLNGRTTTNPYTASTLTSRTVSALGRTQTVVLDSLGRPASAQIAGLSATTVTYDGRGRLATLTVGSGPTARTTLYEYN